jgi:hypothetical protein
VHEPTDLLRQHLTLIADDDLTGAGMAAVLSAAGLTVSRSINPRRPTDVAPAHAVDPTASTCLVVVSSANGPDRYHHVRALRTAAAAAMKTVALLDPGLPGEVLLRVAEAGADRVLFSCGLRPERLLEVAHHPARALPVPTTYDLRRQLGLEARGSVEALIDRVEALGAWSWFDPSRSQAELGIPRRASIGLRQAAAQLAGLRPALHRATGGPTRSTTPHWSETRDLVNRLTGRDRRGADTSVADIAHAPVPSDSCGAVVRTR